MKRVIYAGNKRLEVIASTGSMFCWMRYTNDDGKPCHFNPDRRGLRRLIEALQEAERVIPKTPEDLTSHRNAIG
jgi:hypothetical protein